MTKAKVILNDGTEIDVVLQYVPQKRTEVKTLGGGGGYTYHGIEYYKEVSSSLNSYVGQKLAVIFNVNCIEDMFIQKRGDEIILTK